MLHIRRGDHQAYLPLDYYKDAIKEAGRINNFNYDIYTDDPEWVKSQGIFNNSMNVYGPSKESNIQSDGDEEQILKVNSYLPFTSQYVTLKKY